MDQHYVGAGGKRGGWSSSERYGRVELDYCVKPLIEKQIPLTHKSAANIYSVC